MKTAAPRLPASLSAAASCVATLALCAAFSPAAEGALVLVDYNPDVLLGTFHMDIDGDHTDEYYWSRVEPSRFGSDGFENIVDTFGNAVVGHVATDPFKPGPYADRLNVGDVVDGSRMFISDPAVILSGTTTFKGEPTNYGNFFGVDGAYVGLRFELTDGTHYGFVQMHDPPGDFFIAQLGFDDVAGAPVTIPPGQVPEPGSLALLVAGAAGVLVMRRRQRGS